MAMGDSEQFQHDDVDDMSDDGLDVTKRQLILSIFAVIEVVTNLIHHKLRIPGPLPRTRTQEQTVPMTVYEEYIGPRRRETELALQDDPSGPSLQVLWSIHSCANDLLRVIEQVRVSPSV